MGTTKHLQGLDNSRKSGRGKNRVRVIAGSITLNVFFF